MAIENNINEQLRNRVDNLINKPEELNSPEVKAESASFENEKPVAKAKPTVANKPVNIVTNTPAQDLLKKRAAVIDNILAEGLNDVFLKMNPKEQQAFKVKGEETVGKINLILNQTKVKAAKIINLIKDWLKLIPGINKFFLEQESKIKTDKILKIKDKF